MSDFYSKVAAFKPKVKEAYKEGGELVKGGMSAAQGAGGLGSMGGGAAPQQLTGNMTTSPTFDGQNMVSNGQIIAPDSPQHPMNMQKPATIQDQGGEFYLQDSNKQDLNNTVASMWDNWRRKNVTGSMA
jgi:hypothetical protein